MVDRNGHLEQNRYKIFEKLAGCEGKGLTCLRALDWRALKAGQDRYINFLPAGPTAFGYVNFTYRLVALFLLGRELGKSLTDYCEGQWLMACLPVKYLRLSSYQVNYCETHALSTRTDYCLRKLRERY